MTFHLYTGNPTRIKHIPSTHRYRQITHVEFRNFAKYLELYLEEGKITIGDNGIEGIVLSRILKPVGISVRQHIISPESFRHDKLPPIGEKDFVLVCYPKVYGFYINIAYGTTSDARFKEMVETGIIEPIDSKATERVKIKSIAQELIALNKRIDQAKALLFDSGGDSGHAKGSKIGQDGQKLQEDNNNDNDISTSARKLLDEYLAEKQALLQNEALSDMSKVQEILDKYSHDKEECERRIEEILLRLEIEVNANDNPEARERFGCNLKGLRSKLEVCNDAIEGLKILVAEVKGTRKEEGEEEEQ